jgi:hypothetical protein
VTFGTDRAQFKLRRYPINCSVDFGTIFLYLYTMTFDTQKTKQACLCCTCCTFASSGAGELIL